MAHVRAVAAVAAVAAAVLALAACHVSAIRVKQRAAFVDMEAPAPPFALKAQGGEQVALADGLARGHVLLVFYRGHW